MGKNLVEGWEKILVTSGQIANAKNPRKSGPIILSTITGNISSALGPHYLSKAL